jgi:hypothetical protein
MESKMPYRPEAVHRRNAQGVLLPLTAAIHRVFGHRAQDLGRPIGAFYTVNVSSIVWQHLGGIWYRAWDEQRVVNRSVNESVVRAFSESIITGEAVYLPSGIRITWEEISLSEAVKLPPPLTV